MTRTVEMWAVEKMNDFLYRSPERRVIGKLSFSMSIKNDFEEKILSIITNSWIKLYQWVNRPIRPLVLRWKTNMWVFIAENSFLIDAYTSVSSISIRNLRVNGDSIHIVSRKSLTIETANSLSKFTTRLRGCFTYR